MNKQIQTLNQNALVSLSNDDITKEKVKTNILMNPHTIFLPPANSTVDIIYNFVIDVLFRDHRPLMIITNALQNQMPIYRKTENRYSIFISSMLLQSLMISIIYLYTSLLNI